MVFSSSTVKIIAGTGPTGEPMVTQSVCMYILQLKLKCAFFAYEDNRSFIRLGMVVLISLSV